MVYISGWPIWKQKSSGGWDGLGGGGSGLGWFLGGQKRRKRDATSNCQDVVQDIKNFFGGVNVDLV
jgi:hypothetical protein